MKFNKHFVELFSTNWSASALTFGLFKCVDCHDAIAIAMEMEVIMLKIIREGWKMGAVITDNAGQMGQGRQILALHWPFLAFFLCFDHAINNLVKSVLKKAAIKTVAKAATKAVGILNKSPLKWLVQLQDILVQVLGYKLAVLTLCERRWNSMQECFASLL
jgi:hypothetical protein